MTGYRAFSRQFVKGCPVLSRGFEIETEMTIHALDKNYLLEEIPVSYRDRPAGSVSKLNTVTGGVKVLRMISRLYREYKPMSFFSIAAILCIAIALIFFVPVLIEYLNTGLVLRFPTLIVSCIVGLLGVLLGICGLILDVVVKKHKQLYELMLNQMHDEWF